MHSKIFNEIEAFIEYTNYSKLLSSELQRQKAVTKFILEIF